MHRSKPHQIEQPNDPVDQAVRRLGIGVSGVDDRRIARMTVWAYYYLGVCDGMCEALDSLNPEPWKDAEWRNKLRKYLPLQLAALRLPNSDVEPAVDLIARVFMAALHRPGDQERPVPSNSQQKTH